MAQELAQELAQEFVEPEPIHFVEATTFVCGGFTGDRSGQDLPAMQNILNELKESIETRYNNATPFGKFNLVAYTERTQVVAGTNYCWTAKVQISDQEQTHAQIEIKWFKSLSEPYQDKEITNFKKLYNDERDQQQQPVQLVEQMLVAEQQVFSDKK